MARPQLAPVPVYSEPIDAGIVQLEAFIAQMEAQYGMTTASMVRDVSEGRQPETDEVGVWLAKYHLLTKLRAACRAGRVTG